MYLLLFLVLKGNSCYLRFFFAFISCYRRAWCFLIFFLSFFCVENWWFLEDDKKVFYWFWLKTFLHKFFFLQDVLWIFYDCWEKRGKIFYFFTWTSFVSDSFQEKILMDFVTIFLLLVFYGFPCLNKWLNF